MPDASLSVPIIAAGAAVLGAAIPTVAAMVQDIYKARRDRVERRLQISDAACLDLLRAAGDLRTQVANIYLSHGDEVISRLEEIRRVSASVEHLAVSAGVLAGERFTASASRLADAARILTQATEQKVSLTAVKAMVGSPDFARFDTSVAEFRSKVLTGGR